MGIKANEPEAEHGTLESTQTGAGIPWTCMYPDSEHL